MGLGHHAEEVAAPDLLDVGLGITAREELHGEVDEFGGVGKTADTTVTVEVGTETYMVDAHHLDGMLEMVEDVEDGGLTMATEEAVVDGGLGHTALSGEGAHLVVCQIARMVAEGARTAVAAHDGHTTDVECIVEAALGGMAKIDKNAQTVHLGDDLTPEGADTSMRGIALGRVADIVVAVVAEGHVDDATLSEVSQTFDGAIEGDAVLDAEHDALQTLVLVTPEVCRGTGDGHCMGIRAYHLLDLVEDMIGILSGILRGLGEVGNHDGGVLTSFVHLMEIDEDARVALIDAHALGEEHRRVAVGVEGEHTVVDLLGLAPGFGTTNEPLEEGCSLSEALGMPLDTEDGLILAALDGLDDTIGSHGRSTETGTAIGHGLMVEAVDEELRRVVDLGEDGASSDGHAVGGLAAISIL